MQALRLATDANQPRLALDEIMLGLVLVLSACGVVMMGSASMDFAAEKFGNAFYHLIRHSIYLAMGLVVMAITVRIPLTLWNRAGPALLAAGILLLLLVLVPGIGRKINGATRWIGFSFFNVQPSELVKLCFVIYLAGYIQRRQREISGTLGGMLKPIGLLCLAAAFLLAEPDFGATVVIGGTVVGMLFVAGARLLPFGVLLGLVGSGVAALAVFSPYRLKRLVTFLDPWQDQFASGYQLVQALIAFGRGQVTGVGLGNSVQKLFYLPEAHTDFVFAIIAEELGLIGGVFFIGLFSALVGRILWIGRAAAARQQIFAANVCLGIALIIAGQVFINIGVNAGLLPTKGLTLPFLSYGGSSLLILFAMMGLVLRVEYELRTGNSGSAPPWLGWRVRNA
jgi:cell division protein FtsW